MQETNAHPNVEILQRFYAAMSRRDVAGMLELCSDDVTFQVPGRSRLAGKFTRATFGPQFVEKVSELSGATFAADLHDILASDQHGLVLTTNTLTRAGARQEYRAVHVWRIQGGKLLAWYLYPRDLYQFDAIWS